MNIRVQIESVRPWALKICKGYTLRLRFKRIESETLYGCVSIGYTLLRSVCGVRLTKTRHL